MYLYIMKAAQKILIGGEALRQLGSDRYTNDVDYLINDTTSVKAFLHDTDANVDYCNANGNKFFAAIYADQAGREIATPQALLELKAYSFVQHCQNLNWSKVDACEYDMKFLVRTFGLSGVKVANKFMTAGELSEVNKVINSVKK
jgi:hypothetical protein